MNSRYQQARFLKSATTAYTLPPETGPEVAFAGRSNAGKSSAINVICTQKALARTSKTPGRTQLINFFTLPEERMLVDLPGYGYAKAPEKERRNWGNFIDAYLHQRETLRGLVLLMDVRHPLTDFDRMMLAWAQQQNLAIHILLNKADKLKFGAAKGTLLKVQSVLEKELACPDCSVQLFSALKRQGREEIWQKLDQWLYD